MRTYFVIMLILISNIHSFGQIEQPKNIIIVNDSLISEETLMVYAKEGRIKSMTKGITDQQYEKLKAKLGDQIGEKEFIAIIELYKPGEKRKAQKASSPAKTASDEDILKEGDLAPDFTVTMLDGTTIRLSDLKGKVVLINFWATWCAPCLREFYEIPSKILAPLEGKDFVLLAISKGENKEKVASKMAQLAKKGIQFNVGVDPDATISNMYGANHIPNNFIIDQEGGIKYISTGYSKNSVHTLSKKIQRLVTQ